MFIFVLPSVRSIGISYARFSHKKLVNSRIVFIFSVKFSSLHIHFKHKSNKKLHTVPSYEGPKIQNRKKKFWLRNNAGLPVAHSLLQQGCGMRISINIFLMLIRIQNLLSLKADPDQASQNNADPDLQTCTD
jgi:hypothetical protein